MAAVVSSALWSVISALWSVMSALWRVMSAARRVNSPGHVTSFLVLSNLCCHYTRLYS